MLKRNAKKLLISVALLIFFISGYLCSPFLINFNDEKKTGIENLISELIFYKVNIKGNIKYNLNPLPVLEISEVHLSSEDENSILNQVILNISILDLLQNKFSYKNILLDGGEFIINLEKLKNLTNIEEFNKKKIKFNNVSVKFFNQKKTFTFDQFTGNVSYNENTIDKISGTFNLGEILFKLQYSDNKLSLKSPEIKFKANIENILNEKKIITFDYNNNTIFPGIDEVFASFSFKKDNTNFDLVTEKFETNLFKGQIKINNNNDKNIVIFDGFFDEANFETINTKDLSEFLIKNLNVLADIFDGKIILNFNNFKTNKGIFNNAKFNISFQNGDIFFEDITFYSDKNLLNISGRNIFYQKDKLFFYDLNFETKSLKEICSKICKDSSLLSRTGDKGFNIKSKGILNFNKAKITIKENFTNKQFNDNELNKLNTNVNSIIIFGKLENLFDLSRYFTLL